MNSIALSPNPGAGAARTPPPIVRPIALDRGNVLRIQNGPGVRLCAASGVLWVTEENSLQDYTLLPGDSVRLTHWGMAVVFAHRPSRVVLEVPAGVAVPGTVEIASAEGEIGRRIPLAQPAPRMAFTVAAVVASAFRRVVAWLAAPPEPR